MAKMEPWVTRLLTELLREIRGRRSQSALSATLGYRFNQVYRWESGSTRMTWPDFVRFSEACGIRFDQFCELLRLPSCAGDSQALLQNLVGSTRVSLLSRESGISRFVLANWLHGNSTPPVGFVFHLLRLRSMLIPALNTVVATAKLPCLKDELEIFRLTNRLFTKFPLAAAVYLSLEMKPYVDHPGHSVETLAEATGIPADKIDYLLQLLEKGQFVEKRSGKYVRRSSALIDLRAADDNSDDDSRLFWTEAAGRALRSSSRPPTSGHFAYNMFSVSEQVLEQIQHATVKLFREVQTLVANDPGPPTKLELLAIQLVEVSKICHEL